MHGESSSHLQHQAEPKFAVIAFENLSKLMLSIAELKPPNDPGTSP